jgi:hypothetical protein
MVGRMLARQPITWYDGSAAGALERDGECDGGGVVKVAFMIRVLLFLSLLFFCVSRLYPLLTRVEPTQQVGTTTDGQASTTSTTAWDRTSILEGFALFLVARLVLTTRQDRMALIRFGTLAALLASLMRFTPFESQRFDLLHVSWTRG